MEQGLKHPTPARTGQKQIVENRMAFKHGRFLEFAANAKIGDIGFVHLGQVNFAFKQNIPGIRPSFTSDDIHHRGFTRPVRTNNGAQLARLDIEGQIVQRPETIKSHRHPVDIQDGFRPARFGLFVGNIGGFAGVIFFKGHGVAHALPPALRRFRTTDRMD